MAASLAAPVQSPDWRGWSSTKQKTLKTPVVFSGRGLFTGEKTTLTIHPSNEDTGIVFQREDLPRQPTLFAHLENVVNTPRCTILGGEDFTIHTVEHVLAALKGLGIDNALLKLNGPEIPIMDGSAAPFIAGILAEGVHEQEKEKEVFTLKTPVFWSRGDVHIVAIPSDEFKVSYTLHFPDSDILHSQFYSTPITPDHFIRDIAPCRTFCLYEEIEPFIESGLIKGGGLDNAVIIKNEVVVNPDGLRFNDEMVRHKILDLIGDLSLIPIQLKSHIIAIRSGHASNVAFAHELLNHINRENA